MKSLLINLCIVSAILITSSCKDTGGSLEQPEITGTWELVATFDSIDTIQKNDHTGIKITDDAFFDCDFLDNGQAYRDFPYAFDGQILDIENGKFIFEACILSDTLILKWTDNGFVNIFVSYEQQPLDSISAIGCF